ncbi:Flap endonuclease 1 [Yarrowia sp. B02]|nr:Flap endonuclease 1 [Yarrowia sp. B02]
MGVGDFWQEIEDCRGGYETPESGGISLEGFGKKFYEKHGREPVLAVDLYLTFFQNKEAIGGPRSAPVNMNIAESHKIQKASFFNICSNFLEAGIKIVLVCDGKDKPTVKRLKKRINYTKEQKVITSFREIAASLDIPVVDAAGEGEAQCAHMQREGLADFAYTEDSDVIIFGARRIMRKLKRPKDKEKDADAPKTHVEGKYAIYEMPDDHKWASPPKLLCYAILRGGDYSTGGKFISDVYAGAIAQGGDWAEQLYEISKFDPNSNVVFERPKKEKQLRQWAKALQAEIVQKPIPVMSKNGQKVLKRTIVSRSDLFKDLDKNIGSNAVVVPPELANIESYATPKIIKRYNFTSVSEFKLDVPFFHTMGLELGWINKEKDDSLLFKRLARPRMVRLMKDTDHDQFFTFVNQRDKSSDKDLYKIEYCPYYIVEYPHHTCCDDGEDACSRMKSTVSASILMQSQFDYKQVYVDGLTATKPRKPRAKKHTKSSSTSSNSSINSFYSVTKPVEPSSPVKASKPAPKPRARKQKTIPEEVDDSDDVIIADEMPLETVSSADEILITDEKPAEYDGKFGYGDDFDWDMAMGKAPSKPAKQSTLPGLSRPALSRKPASKVKKSNSGSPTKASKARKQSTLSFLSSKSLLVEVGAPSNLNATIVLSDTEESTEEDVPQTVNLDSSPIKIQPATRIGTRDSQNQFSQNLKTFTSSNDDYTQPFQSFSSPPEPECIELSD